VSSAAVRPKPSGTVAIACQDTARYTAFWHNVAHLELPEGWRLRTACGPDIGWLRHLLAANLEGDYLLYLDDDHTLPSDLVLRLLEHEKDVIGVLNVDRHSLALEPTSEAPGLYEVRLLGTAGMMVHRRVFEALEPPYFRAGISNEVGLVGEDFDFCERVREAGFRIFADTTIALGHITASTLLPVFDEVAGQWTIEVALGLSGPPLDRPGMRPDHNVFVIPAEAMVC
jgi:hypothetical protein